MSDSAHSAGASARHRYPVIDLARGLALIAMMSYHFSWDLANVRLVDWGVASDPLWRGYAMAIASSFLFIAGLSLVLANGAEINWDRALVRLTKVGAGAIAVSIATYFVFPDAWVFFGILHMIFVGSLIGLGLRRLSPPLLVLLAIGALAVPHLLESPRFDAAPLAILGLAETPPISNDFVPLLPWLGPMLLGMAFGRALQLDWLTLTSRPLFGRLGRGLAVLGRWSLTFYLLHQPILFGLALGLAKVLPVDPAIERATFVSECLAGCTDRGGDAAGCQRFCGCVASSVDQTDIWHTRGPDESFGPMLATAAGTCSDDGEEDMPAEQSETPAK